VKLPLSSVVVCTAPMSGTTGIFTEYLSAVSPEWKQKGFGHSGQLAGRHWGQGQRRCYRNVRNTPGAIGYVELAYAQQNTCYGGIQNQAGQYVQPSPAGTTADIAAFSAQLTQDPREPSSTAGQGARRLPISD